MSRRFKKTVEMGTNKAGERSDIVIFSLADGTIGVAVPLFGPDVFAPEAVATTPLQLRLLAQVVNAAADWMEKKRRKGNE